MLQAIQPLSDSDVKSKLKNRFEKGKLHVEALLSNSDQLRKEIEQDFEKNRPFEWNRNQPNRLDETRVEKDWEQHEELTICAMLLNSKEFLKKWGVDYPLSRDGSGLANASRRYIENLERAKDQCAEAIQREYYEYLIEQLNSHPRMR
jgi:ribosomal protein L11 methylase PrmA